MPEQQDLMLLGQEAMEEARDRALEQVREMKASVVNRPAFAKEKTRQERLISHRDFVRNPPLMALEWDVLASRHPPPKPGMVPKRWAEYGVLAAKELAQEEKEAT